MKKFICLKLIALLLFVSCARNEENFREGINNSNQNKIEKTDLSKVSKTSETKPIESDKTEQTNEYKLTEELEAKSEKIVDLQIEEPKSEEEIAKIIAEVRKIDEEKLLEKLDESANTFQSVDNIDTILELYNKFLHNEISVDSIDIDFIATVTKESKHHYDPHYAFFDSNGDGAPELHVKSARYCYVYTYRKNELVTWAVLSPEPYHYALNDGAFIAWLPMGREDFFCYFILDYLGNETCSVYFSKEYGDENITYRFEGEEVSKEDWQELGSKYFDFDYNDISKYIRNQVEMTALYEKN